MRLKLAASAIALLALAGPALSAEFYIVQDSVTKKCTIVDKKPTTQTTVVGDDGKVYTTRTGADAGMKTVKVCSSM